jgi:hypothetical protein
MTQVVSKGKKKAAAQRRQAPRRPVSPSRHSRRLRLVTLVLVMAVFVTIAVGVAVSSVGH